MSVNNVSAQEHASSENRHNLNFRVMAVRDIKPERVYGKIDSYLWIFILFRS